MDRGIFAVIGAIGGGVAAYFGGWDMGLAVLVCCMAVDYITGLLVAGVFGASPKSANGALESRAGWKGLVRKCVTLLMVLVANLLDRMMGTTFVRDAVVIGYTANEVVSITENAGLMGVPVPAVIGRAIDVLKGRSDGKEDGTE